MVLVNLFLNVASDFLQYRDISSGRPLASVEPCSDLFE
jgi:hypothetical protein